MHVGKSHTGVDVNSSLYIRTPDKTAATEVHYYGMTSSLS